MLHDAMILFNDSSFSSLCQPNKLVENQLKGREHSGSLDNMTPDVNSGHQSLHEQVCISRQ